MPTGLTLPPDLSSPHTPVVPTNGHHPSRVSRESAVELDWRYYVSSVIRHKRVVGAIVVLGLAAGIAVARWLKPTYAARANLWVEITKDGSGNPGPTWSSQLLSSAGWIDLLRSDVIVVDAVRKQRLYLLPRTSTDAAALGGFGLKEEFRPGVYRLEVDALGQTFTLKSGDGEAATSGTVGDSVGNSLGFVWVPPASALTPGRRIDFEVVSLYEAAQKLLEKLEIRPGRERSFIRMELHASDPVLATKTINSMAAHFVEVAADLKRQKLTELTAILGEQLNHAQSSLNAAEEELKNFRARTAPLALQKVDPASAAFLATRLEQEQLRADRDAIARALVAADSGMPIQALEKIGAVQRSPELSRALADLTSKQANLRAIRRRYTDAVPEVQGLASDVQNLERGTIRSLARVLMNDLAAHEARLARQFESTSQGLREMSPVSVEEARLDRNVRVAEELFINLRKRYEESRLAEVSVTPDVRILDVANVPEKPLYNRAPLAILLALMGSCAVAVMTAVAMDLADPKVRYHAQVAKGLGLPVLGALPHVGTSVAKNADDLAPVIEALRGIRFNLVHAHGAGGPLLLTVTSPGMGDGKSFVASNLALAFADARYRTLLIDGDIRRGALHRVLRASRKPGLTDFLAGEVSREAVIQTTAYPSLSFIGSGARRRGGPELLSSSAMAQMVTDLRPLYDIIVIDSSPLAAGIDPYALATLTGNLLLVIRTGVTNRQLAEAKLDLIARLPVRVLGAVINDIRPNGEYVHYSYYLAGYELDEETDAPPGAGRRIMPGVGGEVGAGAGNGGGAL
jgi:capsular exopolysaccharide synthesis family protein